MRARSVADWVRTALEQGIQKMEERIVEDAHLHEVSCAAYRTSVAHLHTATLESKPAQHHKTK
eukprot:3501349-Pleurochrysis_carterae.AAC.3